MYGGRAIDNFDRRVLNTYMNEYMGDFIFDTFQPFHFYHNEDVDYKIPEDGPRDNYTSRCHQAYTQTWESAEDLVYFRSVGNGLTVIVVLYKYLDFGYSIQVCHQIGIETSSSVLTVRMQSNSSFWNWDVCLYVWLQYFGSSLL